MKVDKHTSPIWEDGGFGAYTKQEDIYLSHLERQDNIKSLLKHGSVLEIGPGTGKYAGMLIDTFKVKKYTILDLEKNISDSLTYLKKYETVDLQGICSQDYKKLFNQKFDVLVSNVVIPETPKDYREDLLNNVLPNCKSSMIICQIKEKDDVGNDPMEFFFDELYNRVYTNVVFELTSYRNCYCLIGY
jgi:phospholipid N-methyltransferase